MITLAQEDAHDPPSVRLNVDVQQVMRQQVSFSLFDNSNFISNSFFSLDPEHGSFGAIPASGRAS